eukprot:199349-Prymnesium_polylepis.1
MAHVTRRTTCSYLAGCCDHTRQSVMPSASLRFPRGDVGCGDRTDRREVASEHIQRSRAGTTARRHVEQGGA